MIKLARKMKHLPFDPTRQGSCECRHWREYQVEVDESTEGMYLCVCCGMPWLESDRIRTGLDKTMPRGFSLTKEAIDGLHAMRSTNVRSNLRNL